ncbi:hypothetical protein JTB14_002630 [Gonioctena quinquepunctata]|nr:hypothetical protein JTB14_002630 [Gonioctena quinquepunctata]
MAAIKTKFPINDLADYLNENLDVMKCPVEDLSISSRIIQNAALHLFSSSSNASGKAVLRKHILKKLYGLIYNMRAPLYVLCATLIVAIRSEEPAAANTNYFNRQLEPINLSADQETISYLLPRLAAKYRPNNDWTGVTDPRFYLLTDMETNDFDNQVAKDRRVRNKRYNLDVYQPRQIRYLDEEPSLSINANIHNLRQAYANSRLRQRLAANRKFLDNLPDTQ